MIRHAERPHIDRTDPTFGETLALTPAGQAAAFDLGTLLAPMSGDAEFHSSPMNRTRETARQIALGLGLSATHDLYAAAFLTARNAAEFTATNWIGFLESAAIIDRPNGTRHYAYIQLAR